MDREYVAFISYRHAPLDSAVAKALHSAIEQYRIPRGVAPGRRRLGLVFRDKEELHAASDLSQKITQALDHSEYLIVVCSENTAQSPWVEREIDQFLLTHDRDHVLTVLASGEPKDVFPYRLTHVMDPATGREMEIEPLAVDLRADSPGAMRKTLRRELVRLAAPMLGCPLDALVLREQRRKLRQFASSAALVLAVALGFSATVMVKNRQIQDKNHQLAQKNDELAAQKAQIQLRESELLTADALEALKQGDYAAAIRSAAMALPRTGDPDRPYLADAEAALMEAVGLFSRDDQDYVLRRTDLVRTTVAQELVIHTDGSKLLCIDSYGTVSCYATDGGSLLWQTQVTDPDSSSLSDHPRVFLAREETLAVACFGDVLQAWDLENGSPVWCHGLENWEEDYLFYHPETDVFVYLTCEQALRQNCTTTMQVISGADGQTVRSQELFTESTASGSAFTAVYFDEPAAGGVFSTDGQLFAGVYLDPEDRPWCFTVNLETGSSSHFLLGSHSVNYDYEPMGLFLGEDDRSLILVAKGYRADTELSALSVDLLSQDLVWQTDLDPDGSSLLLFSCHSIITKGQLLLSLNNRLFWLDPATGEQLYTKSLSADTTLLKPVSERLFGVATADGRYALGWLTNDGIHLTTDPLFGVSTDLGRHSGIWIWGQGITQLYTDSGGFLLGLADLAQPGFVVLQPENETGLRILQPVLPEALLEEQSVPLPQQDLTAGSAAWEQAGGTLIIGPLERRLGILQYAYGYALIDASTGALKQYIELEQQDRDGVYFLPDGSGYLAGGPSAGTLELRTPEGESTTLHIYKDTDQLTQDRVRVTRALASTYLADGTLLSVACNAMDLTFWHNGVLVDTLALPEALTVLPEDFHYCTRSLTLGANGWAFAATWVEDSAIPLANTAVLNTADGTWVTLEGEGYLSNSKSFCLAAEAPVLAAADSEGFLRIFDLTTGRQLSRFSPQTPPSSICSIAFFPDGRYLAVATEDGGLFLFDAETGEPVYRDILELPYGDVLRLAVDEENKRLYISGRKVASSGTGVLLETESWTLLARIQGLLLFDRGSGLLYRFHDPVLGLAGITYGTVPSARELADLALAQ